MHTVVCFNARRKRLNRVLGRCLPVFFLALLGLLAAGNLNAQNSDQGGNQDNTVANEERQVRRLGDLELQEEYELELSPSDQESAANPDRISLESEISNQLAAARVAMQEGRVDQPETDCAWYFYRKALDLDPENREAERGLLTVQQEMVSRALEYARDLDFESAERILEDATFVREPQDLIVDAREEIASFLDRRAEELEIAAVTAMDAGNFNGAERILIDLIALGGADPTVNQLRRRLEEARVYGGFQPGQVIRDHFLNEGLWTPDAVVILAGSFVMGAPASEEGREDNEGPQHRVTFRRGFAIGMREVSVAEFKVFTDKTGYKTDAQRGRYSTVYDQYSGRLMKRDGVNWKMDYEGAVAGKDSPVVHVSWNDANAYVNWLSRGTGKPYRLPSEAEFEYAVRGGKSSRYWWGDGSPKKIVENLTGEGDSSRSRRRWSTFFAGYTDNYWGPAPVGSFGASPFGLYDIAGNVGEWVRDCWHDTYIRAPADGSAWLNPGCKLRVIRGGYWASSPDQTRSAFRLSAKPDRRDARIGFRIARDL